MEISKYLKIMLTAAQTRGIRARVFGATGKVAMLSRGHKHTFICQSMTEMTANTAFKISANKYSTDYHLRRGGFPVPAFRLVHNFREARAALKIFKQAVVKPLCLNQGRGITVGVNNVKELRSAIKYALAAKHSRSPRNYQLLMEKRVIGDDHRLLVIDYNQVFAIKKTPAYVVGDGHSSIARLIENKNKRRATHKKPIVIDNELRRVLKSSKMTLRSCPAAGRQVFLRYTANLATGGESEDITDRLPVSLKNMVVRAAKYLQLPVVGFDFMTQNIDSKRGYLIEANPVPGLLIHNYPTLGQARRPALAIIDMLINHGII